MEQPMTASDLDRVPGEEIVSRRARLALHPEVVGHITAVHIYDAGRSYTFQWWVDDGMRATELNGFQLELID